MRALKTRSRDTSIWNSQEPAIMLRMIGNASSLGRKSGFLDLVDPIISKSFVEV